MSIGVLVFFSFLFFFCYNRVPAGPVRARYINQRGQTLCQMIGNNQRSGRFKERLDVGNGG